MQTRRAALLLLLASGLGISVPITEAVRKKRAKRNKRQRRKHAFPKSLNLSGVGPYVSKPFRLAAGLYRADATAIALTASGGVFFVYLYDAQDQIDYVFIEDPLAPGTYQFESLVKVPANGTFVIYVEGAEGAWTLSLQPAIPTGKASPAN